MTEEEIEAVAEELAKIGGVSWYPGRTPGPLLRVVGDRYRDRARVAIAAIERLRAERHNAAPQGKNVEGADPGEILSIGSGDQVRVGAIVVYRPPGEKRAIPCTVEKLEGGRAYLVPCPRQDIGWVPVEGLRTKAEGD